MNHLRVSKNGTRQTMLISLALTLLIGLSYVWFHPVKMQSIISISQKPAVFYVEDGYHEYNGEANIDFQRELVDSWCLKLHDDNVSLYNTGDYLLVYQDFDVRISPSGGFLYSQATNKNEKYQILNSKAVEKIRAELDQNYVRVN